MNLEIEEPKSRSLIDSQMIPLINVVFLMLAFFMIAGQMQRADNVPLETPVSASDMEREPDPITISIDSDERLFIDGLRVAREELSQQVASFVSDSGSSAPPTVLLRADAALPASTTRELLQTLQHCGLDKVSLATLQSLKSSD